MGIIIPPSPHPLPAQPTPLGVFPTYCFPHPVTLALREKVLNLSGDGFSITDTDGRVVAKCKGKFLTMHDRTNWTTPDGSPLFTLAKKLLSLPRKYAAEDAGGKELFVVASKIALGSKMVASFRNTTDKRKIELTLRGDVWGKSAEICCGDVPVAFINRKVLNLREAMFGQDTYLVTVAPGVDVVLIAAFCVTFDNMENDEKN